jgi:hypothetical protein
MQWASGVFLCKMMSLPSLDFHELEAINPYHYFSALRGEIESHGAQAPTGRTAGA